MNYIITGKNYTSPLIKAFEGREGYQVLSEEVLGKSDIQFTDSDRVYAPDETSVPALLSRMPEKRKAQMEVIKNKYRCRELLSTLYADFYFKSVSLNELDDLVLPSDKRFIIKPQKGFFGVGVKEIDCKSDLKQIAQDLKAEMMDKVKFFSEEMFTMDDFIIEEFIAGEEYAFDLFYDGEGKPVITSICHHPQATKEAYFHLLYYTGKVLFDRFQTQVMEIFTEFNKSLNLTNLPIHAEFREVNGRLVPIEFNIPRYGGFGLADLPFHAYGVNSFAHFFDNDAPNWNQLLQSHEGKLYGWVLCYNGTEVDLEKQKPDYEALKADLGKVLHLHVMDYKTNPVFAIAYVEIADEMEKERILALEFNDYFV